MFIVRADNYTYLKQTWHKLTKLWESFAHIKLPIGVMPTEITEMQEVRFVSI